MLAKWISDLLIFLLNKKFQTTKLKNDINIDRFRQEDIKDPEIYKQRLHAELIHRESEKNIAEHTDLFSLTFKNSDIEQEYRESRDITSCISLLGLPFTLFIYLLSFVLIGPFCLQIYLTLVICLLLLIVKAFICTISIIWTVIIIFLIPFCHWFWFNHLIFFPSNSQFQNH